MSTTINKKWLFIKLAIFYCLLSSARAVCTFGENTIIDLLLSIIVFMYFSSNGLFCSSNRKQAATMCMIIAVLWSMHGSMLYAYIGQLCLVAIPLMLINLKEEVQAELLEFLTKALVISLCVSFCAWILHFFSINLPYTESQLETDYSYGFIVRNYYLFREAIGLSYDGIALVPDYFRFNGFFLEPGHTGTIAAFFLFANRYDFSKWYNKILVAIIIVTVSAAAYALALIGYLFCVINNQNKVKIIVGGLLCWLAILYASQYNGGDNVVNHEVVDKIMNSSRGLENRFTDEVQVAYENLWKSDDIIFGSTRGANVSHSAGYKVFIIQQGLIGAFLVILSYWLISRIKESKLAFLFLVFAIFSFLQRVYFHWDAFIDPFILGTATMYKKIKL